MPWKMDHFLKLHIPRITMASGRISSLFWASPRDLHDRAGDWYAVNSAAKSIFFNTTVRPSTNPMYTFPKANQTSLCRQYYLVTECWTIWGFFLSSDDTHFLLTGKELIMILSERLEMLACDTFSLDNVFLSAAFLQMGIVYRNYNHQAVFNPRWMWFVTMLVSSLIHHTGWNGQAEWNMVCRICFRTLETCTLHEILLTVGLLGIYVQIMSSLFMIVSSHYL